MEYQDKELICIERQQPFTFDTDGSGLKLSAAGARGGLCVHHSVSIPDSSPRSLATFFVPLLSLPLFPFPERGLRIPLRIDFPFEEDGHPVEGR